MIRRREKRITLERYIGELDYPIRSPPWDLPRSGSSAVARSSTAGGGERTYNSGVSQAFKEGIFFFFYKVATFRDYFH